MKFLDQYEESHGMLTKVHKTLRRPLPLEICVRLLHEMVDLAEGTQRMISSTVAGNLATDTYSYSSQCC